ncbi:hypothetical protein PFICI_14417 [Pestalotiopsis fici W106-1]|uniref:NAD-dependent epimerase/dehydratase domain-containing protein n=1 Tax=Pestalotiopsis fici (strain W106-1 / CGMCC3.15140) TaxID=1229662 RepID=W3WKX7_PESFW|nr:uncharacterized protein PFICI_14417 [Pestalotiopsis fici W106-1]ETS73471.1 hypothetical protein PFICI_14417 [Pestalotiopsis fici W106-1]
MSGSKGEVLVTGANGYIGARTVGAFLDAGYSVRGTVRSSSAAESLLEALPDAVSNGRLKIDQVPDITAPGAFDKAVRGVTAIVHLATPVSFFFTNSEYIVGTAVNGVKAILESATKEPRIKHFLLMSSIAAIISEKQQGHVFTETDWNDAAARIVAEQGDQAPSRQIYGASKVLAEREFWKFMQERQPKFTMNAINPVLVGGPPLVLPSTPDKLNESVSFIWQVLSGQGIPENLVGFGAYVDVRDVARLAVFSVEHGNQVNAQRYMAASGWASPQAAADVLRQKYPGWKDSIQKGAPQSNYLPGYKYPPQAPQIDASKAVRATGQGWIRFDDMVVDTAEVFKAYLE